MIKYTNIYFEEYKKLSSKERIKPYCIEYPNGDIIWRVNKKLHLEEGPAIEFSNGINYWFLNDVEYSFEEWCNKLNKTDEQKIFLKLKYI